MLDNVLNFNGDRDTRDMMSEAKFFEGYSRWDESKGRYETWGEAVERVMNMHRQYYADKMTPELSSLIDEAESAYKSKLVLGAQRALQFGGEQLLKHQMRLYNCLAEETKFVTHRGLKTFKDFKDGDITIVKTHKGNWKSAKVKTYGKQKLYKITLGRDKLETSKRIFYATKDHRWILENGEFSNNIQIGDKLFEFVDNRNFGWDTASELEKLYWCYGMIYGDGTTQGGSSKIRLCGKDTRFLYRFEYFGWKHSNNHSLQGDVIVFTGKYQKTLPDLEKDPINLIEAFINGYLTADGTKGPGYWDEDSNYHETSFGGIYAKKKEASDFIRKCFSVAGYHTSSEKCTMRETNFGIHDGQTFTFVGNENNKYSKKIKVLDIEETDRYEDVWCLEVEDDESFILEYGIATGNCTSTYADRPEYFGEYFYALLCGAGVGSSVSRTHTKKMPDIQQRTKQAKIHVIEDSIEGWANAADVLMSSYFVGGGKNPEFEGRRVFFDTSKIRAKGSFISGGFKAPGPEPLRLALDRVEHLLQDIVLSGGSTLEPIHIYDISMYLADAVLSGGVRRSATIFLFDIDDDKMMKSKTGDWYIKHPQRARSNNSAIVLRNKTTKSEFDNLFESTRQFGEPGFAFLDNEYIAYNPCFEIGMVPHLDGKSGFQGCNLTEINGGQCNTRENFILACKSAAIIGTLQAGYTDFKFVTETTRKIFEREALLGVSVTGWMNNPDVLLNEEYLTEGAKLVLSTNELVANIIGINVAARATAVKPSGNASVLLQTASGIHGEHAPLYIRNVQMNKETEVAQLLRKTNPYMVEESVWSSTNSDYVISFPVISPVTSIYKKDLYGIGLLEKVKFVQRVWVENGTRVDKCIDKSVRHNVSNTISVQPHQWDEVRDYLFDNRQYFAGVSLLSASGDYDYNQAPMTQVLTENEIVSIYGRGAMFASGLIVDANKGFRNLWEACSIARMPEDMGDKEVADIRAEWIRRFEKYTTNYFNGDQRRAEYCLKAVHILHRWEKIQQNLSRFEFVDLLQEKKYTDIDSMGAQACSGTTGCEI